MTKERRQSGRVYTKTGDDGTTGLRGGIRARKDDPRLETCGTVDELNSSVGLALAVLKKAAPGVSWETLKTDLRSIQQQLCNIETLLLTPEPNSATDPKITVQDVELLEKSIDRMSADLPPLDKLILPGGGLASAHLHICRAICRRVERRCVALEPSQPVSDVILRYLNRLSDHLFVAARWVAFQVGEDEIHWQTPG
ncbi:MAG: cob(I)yrinic acid a,c-diamide adenosyltransferase [bacterium]